jgi:hypothetical protein
MQTFLMYVVIVVLMAPLMLFYGLPFIFAAKLFHAATPIWLTQRTRFVAACGIAALGIAPAFDEFLTPKSIYLVWLDGGSVPLPAVAASLALTWLVVMFQLRMLARHRAHQYT